ncbi:inosine/xanthosine triphosphatase [Halobacteria archaeon AArc-m2/3/4]|uniref:inosine/xanthosine triphosphatase n=1 Tax=Natronoglomus mannanivorans TaxID=2979990 RepID=A0AAP2YYQ0_9EURY|nr:inosine/xanthosine triphosphatase [Halobacteria archaeon AArc-xg1-1]MCU4975088.1 inosine/xanthosine triphosphatase [Halobacteria archaeon AArc-m2/3/4]
MHVAVGSTNPVKRAAVERALERFEPTVTVHSVDSSVAEQPRSVAETITGAENRARRALEAGSGGECEPDSEPEREYGVGLEGGVARLEGTPGLYLIMWAAATDGETVGRGGGPSLRLPDHVATRVESGEELGPVMDDVLGAENVAENEGAAGALTDGLTDRRGALATAVACAFGPFVTSYY